MDQKQPGKLKYINGIPYLTSHHVPIEERPPAWPERLLTAWQRRFGRRLGGALLVLAIVSVVAVLGGLIDFVLIGLTGPGN